MSDAATTVPWGWCSSRMMSLTTAPTAETSMLTVPGGAVYGPWNGPQSVAVYVPVNVNVCGAWRARWSTWSRRTNTWFVIASTKTV
jgi:hypothetical protein